MTTQAISAAAAQLLSNNPNTSNTIQMQINRVLVKGSSDANRLFYAIGGWQLGEEVVTLTRDEAIKMLKANCPVYTDSEATSLVKTARAKGMSCIYIHDIVDEDGIRRGSWAGRGECPLTEEWMAEQHYSSVPGACIHFALKVGNKAAA